MNSKNTKFIILIFILILLVSNIATFYITKDYVLKNNNGDIEKLEIEFYTYTNEELGFKINLPKGFELEEVEKNIRLISEGGPLGNRLVFVDNSREKGKYIIIRNTEKTDSYVLKTILEIHSGNPFTLQEASYVKKGYSDILIKLGIGSIMAFQPRDIPELRGKGNEIPGYFEINASRDLENGEAILKEMFKSFEVIPIETGIPESATLKNPPEKDK